MKRGGLALGKILILGSVLTLTILAFAHLTAAGEMYVNVNLTGIAEVPGFVDNNVTVTFTLPGGDSNTKTYIAFSAPFNTVLTNMNAVSVELETYSISIEDIEDQDQQADFQWSLTVSRERVVERKEISYGQNIWDTQVQMATATPFYTPKNTNNRGQWTDFQGSLTVSREVVEREVISYRQDDAASKRSPLVKDGIRRHQREKTDNWSSQEDSKPLELQQPVGSWSGIGVPPRPSSVDKIQLFPFGQLNDYETFVR